VTNPVSTLYTHRRKADGSHDSICLACLATISSQMNEEALAREEEDHVCKFRFPSKRKESTAPSELRTANWKQHG
jgi:hypothetical protein